MGFHTYDIERADALEDPTRYAYLSVDELLALLDPDPDAAVVDLGSGTGFYTDDVAPAVGSLYAVDLQAAMHRRYREKGVPTTVDLLTAVVAFLPFEDAALDGAFSTMTYHEFGSDAAAAEIARVLAPGAPLAIADWTAEGAGTTGPPLDERYTLAEATATLEQTGFDIEYAAERRETFVLRGRR